MRPVLRVRDQGVLKVDPASAGPDGSFSIAGVPPDAYVVEAWHEKFGTATEHITVDYGQTTTLSFTFRNRERP